MLFPIELHILKRAFDNMNILLVAVQARDEKQRELRREESEKENEWEEKREITRPSLYPICLLFCSPPSWFERLELHAGSLSQSTFIMLQSGPHPTPPPPLWNVVPLFELPLGNYKHSNFWMEDGGSMDYFALLGDSASTILSACITGALWAKQLEANAAFCAKRETR